MITAILLETFSLGPPEIAERNEQRAIICDLLRFLSSRQRGVIELRYFAGMELAETARVFRTNVHSIREIERQAILKLQRILAIKRQQ